MDTISPCLYPASLVLLRICRQGRPLLAPSRIFAARVSTRPAQQILRLRSGFRLRTQTPADGSSCQRTKYKPFTNSPATAGSRLFRSAHPGLKSRAGGPQLASELLDADTSRLRRNATQLLRGTAIEGRRHQPRLPQLIPESHRDRR